MFVRKYQENKVVTFGILAATFWILGNFLAFLRATLRILQAQLGQAWFPLVTFFFLEAIRVCFVQKM